MNPRTILVVEDDPNDENLTLRALRGVNVPCSVVVARSGSDALDFLLRHGVFKDRSSADPDVVFLDNTLPGIAGNELVSKIRESEHLRSIPLVVFSGSSDENLVARCLSAGASGFVEKPMDMSDYLATLRKTAEHWLSTTH
ncbi:response regulator [bacterium]|nr:MAG: response regulator [bacterium]